MAEDKKPQPRKYGNPDQTPAEDRVELSNMRKWRQDDQSRPQRNYYKKVRKVLRKT